MSKYGNKRTFDEDGRPFDSGKELRRYRDLRLLELAGKISELQTQVKYELIPEQRDNLGKLIERAVMYTADFVYREHSALGTYPVLVVEDCKGFKTRDYIIKRKLMLKIHGIRIRET